MGSQDIGQNLLDNNNNWMEVRDAIQRRGQSTTNKTTADYADLIDAIVGVLQTKTINPSTSQQTVTPDQNYDGLSQVVINAVTAAIDANIIPENIKKDIIILGTTGTYEGGYAPSLQSKTATPSISQQTISPDQGYDGLSSVIIQAVTAAIDANIVSSNIKQGVAILGVTGNYTGDIPAVTNLNYFFYKNARSIDDYWGLVTSLVTSMIHMCDDVNIGNKSLTIDISGITSEANIDSVFYKLNMSGIVSLLVVNNGSLTSLKKFMYGDAASGSSNYYFNVTLDTDNSDFSLINNLEKTFVNKYFDTIDITALSGNQITTLAETFRNADVLTDIVGLNSISGALLSNMYRAFFYFNNNVSALSDISTLDLSNIDISNVTDIREAFSNCHVNSVKFKASSVIDNCNMASAFATGEAAGSTKKNISSIQNLNIQETTMLTNRPFNGTFNNKFLTSITSPNAWNIKSGLYHMFDGALSLTDIPAIIWTVGNSSYAQSFENVFQNCGNIEEVDITISNPNNYKIYVSTAFSGCTKLKYVKGNFDLSNVDNLNNIFTGCSSLISIKTTGNIADNLNSNQTLDVSASTVFDISDYIDQLAAKNTSYTRNIKVNSAVYANITQATFDAATAKGYTIIQ